MYDFNPEEGPNDDGAELSFCEDEVLAIFGEMDEDQFFLGQNRFGVRALVPSNFIREIDQQTARGLSPELFDSVQGVHIHSFILHANANDLVYMAMCYSYFNDILTHLFLLCRVFARPRTSQACRCGAIR